MQCEDSFLKYVIGSGLVTHDHPSYFPSLHLNYTFPHPLVSPVGPVGIISFFVNGCN